MTRWIPALLVVLVIVLLASGLLPKEPEPRPQVIALDEFFASGSSLPSLMETSTGLLTPVRIVPQEGWRSNPSVNEILLVLNGSGRALLPQGEVELRPEELLIVFQGTAVEIHADEELRLLVFSTPLPEEPTPSAGGGLLPMTVDLSERLSRPLEALAEGIEGTPVFESPTGSVWLLRATGTWDVKRSSLSSKDDLALYALRGRAELRTAGRKREVLPGQLIVLPTGASAALVGEGALFLGFRISTGPNVP